MLLEEPTEEVTCNYYIKEDDIIVISFFKVNVRKGIGLGTDFYKKWEATIPKEYKKIELYSKNTLATKFWKKMGFDDDYNLDHKDGSCCMSKMLENNR